MHDTCDHVIRALRQVHARVGAARDDVSGLSDTKLVHTAVGKLRNRDADGSNRAA
jgi:hypothetical protein